MDRLAQHGVRFDLAYANQAVCAPSRINLMSGARSTSSGIYNFGMNLRDYMPDAVTLPQYFMRAGYHTESMGKVYHLGHGTVGDTAGWSVTHHKEKVRSDERRGGNACDLRVEHGGRRFLKTKTTKKQN